MRVLIVRPRARPAVAALTALLIAVLLVASSLYGTAAAAGDEPAAWLQGGPGDVHRQGELVVAGETVFEITGTHRMDATAYTAGPESTGKRPGHPAYGITRSGTVVAEGRTVAVDPAVIPLGTWLYIEGLGLFRAEDTGGAIQGDRIDVYIEEVDRALSFGFRPGLTVHVLRPAGTAPAF